MRYGYGVDVGGTTIKLAYFEESGKMLEKWEIPTNISNNGEAILPDIAAAVASHLVKTGTPKEQIVGIGLGVPGPVLRDGTVNKCINLGWGVFNVEKALRAVPGVSDVVVDLAAKNATVEAEASVDDEALKTAVDDLGFVVKGIA